VGKNSSLLAPTFLNLIGNIAARAGGVPIRIGGNTQEYAVMLDRVPGEDNTGKVFGKENSGTTATVCVIKCLSFQNLNSLFPDENPSGNLHSRYVLHGIKRFLSRQR